MNNQKINLFQLIFTTPSHSIKCCYISKLFYKIISKLEKQSEKKLVEVILYFLESQGKLCDKCNGNYEYTEKELAELDKWLELLEFSKLESYL